MKTILISDELFVGERQLERIRRAGFAVDTTLRSVPAATEEQVLAAIPGKAGYILGGTEIVTERIIAAADKLEAIAFTGSGYSHYVPAYPAATKKGIAVCAARGANAIDVAEYTIALVLEMTRRLPLLRTRNKRKGNSFSVTTRLAGKTLGIIGYGPVGREVATRAVAFGMNVLVYSHWFQRDLPAQCRFSALSELLACCDVVSIHGSELTCHRILGETELATMKDGAIVVNCAFPAAVDPVALAVAIRGGKVRAAFDSIIGIDLQLFSDLSEDQFNYSNGPTAFNTVEGNLAVSDRVVDSVVNLLEGRDDVDVVNPEFVKFRAAAAR